MQCPQCQHENSKAAKFCEECGTKLARTCPGCGHEVSPKAKFCPECGIPLTAQSLASKPSDSRSRTPDSGPIRYTPPHLAERILAEQAAMEARGATDGERKTITALFADIKGSMELIEGLDPEEARHIVDPALQFMMEAVHRYEGYVAQSMGDGVLALFGAPIAHEDHPQRALYAALRMQEESRRYAEKLRLEKGLNLQIRVGVNTGEVVVRSIRKDDLHTDYVPIGHSTSLAARMESLATPGSIVVEYTFKHALTQEVAYNSLLIERRRVLHERTAQAIEELYRYRLDDHYSELAYHYTRSGNAQKAVEYLRLAGQQAVQRSAHVEAITHLIAALELLKTLPDTPERTQQELTLQTVLGPALMATKSFAAPEVEQAYARARELCQRVGKTPQLFPVLWGLWVFHSIRGELQTAQELGEQLLSLAQRVQDLALLLEAHHALWANSFWLGELASAREHCEQGIALYDPQQHRSLAFLYGGHDPGVCCRDFAALALWVLGYPDQALKRSHDALTLARELSHPFSLAEALGYAAWLYEFRREGQAVQEGAAALIALSNEHGFLYWSAQGPILRGWALAEQGQGKEGIAQMRQGLAAYKTTGAEAARPYYLVLLAEAYGKAGQAEEGLTTLAEALAFVHKNGGWYYEAELYRLKGQLTLQQFKVQGSPFKVTNPQPLTPNPRAGAEAEACFHKAIEIARRQSAKSLELRAVMSLSRLWQNQSKKEGARQMLAEIYGWFTEGFDTKDLREAKILLEQLSR